MFHWGHQGNDGLWMQGFWSGLDWSDDDEPVLPSSPICKDSYKCISGWVDWICSMLHSDEPIDFMAFPYDGTQLKNLKLLALIWYWFTLSLLVQATKLLLLTKNVVLHLYNVFVWFIDFESQCHSKLFPLLLDCIEH
jgi:hypothetical protein